MKVLLINPSFKRKIGKTERVSPVLPPIGLACLAGVLKKENIETRILDLNALNLTQEQTIDYIKNYNPNLIGIGAVTTTIFKSFNLAEIIKQNFPEKQIVFGGPHPTALPLESIKKNFVDFVVIGEGEITLLELTKELMKKGKKNFKKVNGLVFKKNNKIIINKLRENIKNLDSLPFPAIELLPLDKYISRDTKYKKFMSIITSRGCPGRCTFCNKKIFGYNCYMRSAENIIQEIEYLNKKYGYRDFHILDDLFTNDRKRVVDFCNFLIKKNLKIRWKCANGVRVNTVDLELLKLMKKTGCYMLNYGVESGNQKILNLMKKGQTLKQVEEAVGLTKKVGINCGCCFMFGNIGENQKTMQETIDFAKKLNPDIAMFSILIPYPGTPVRETIEKEGRIFINDWNEYDNFEGIAIFEHGELKKEIMEKMYKKAYKEFYLRPTYIIRQIFKIRNLNEMRNRLNAFLALFEM